MRDGVVGEQLHHDALVTVNVYLKATEAMALNEANLHLDRMHCDPSGRREKEACEEMLQRLSPTHFPISHGGYQKMVSHTLPGSNEP